MASGNLLFQFSGRTSRGQYWLAWLITIAIYLAFLALGYLTESVAIQTLTGMVVVVLAISAIAVGIKRLQDRNKSGWYVVLFYVAPCILFFIGMRIGGSPGGSAIIANGLGLVAFAIVIWAFVELGCLRGSIGVNPYGPDPVAPAIVPPVRNPRG